jgi:alkaline phosphatase D
MSKPIVFALFIAFSMCWNIADAQNPNAALGLVSGPMLGYVEHKEVLIWLEVNPTIKAVEIQYWQTSQPQVRSSARYTGKLQQRYNPIKIPIGGLEINAAYSYEVFLNGRKVVFPYPLRFKTKEIWEWRKPAPDFSFLMGSCFYINDSTYDRPGKPYGKNPAILDAMGNIPSDFMLWMGDNLYLREADYSSAAGIAYRYNYNFKIPQMQKLRATRANYAIWDDHDYGPNDSDAKFELKETTFQTFKNYWGNKTFGEADNPGVYGKVKWSDADFLLMDDRYYRSSNSQPDSVNGKPNAAKIFYGKKQMDWLKNNLISSEATFKFIVTGGQMLNPMADKECFIYYPAEWHELIDFIVDNKIEGVIFLTGDRHFSELIKYRPKKPFYTLYDFTCSSVTSGIHDISKTPEMQNPNRMTGSLLLENNFGKISVSGVKGARIVTLETYDLKGAKRWSYQIPEQELRVRK